MSEFIAEAQVLVRPNTASFRAQLQAQLTAATKGIVVPIQIAPVATRGVTSLTGATSGLTAQNAVLSRSAVEVAAAQEQVRKSTERTTSALLGAKDASAKLDAGLLGLRTALGSSAVIGLGAISLAAIAAGQAIRGLLIQTAQFQQEISTFRAVTGATADEMDAVAEAARRLGADVTLPAVSASDAAVAMTELAKAGLSVEESIAGARGVLQLATAAQISNAEASQIAANALNSFGLAGDQATRVADDLANAANAAQGSISDFGFAFAQSSAVARQVGLSLEDTTAILSLFAKNGLQGSDAGTSLRVALIRLVAPTKAAADEIRKLGLNIRDAQGNVRADVFAQFGQATKDLGPAARDAAAALIFGQDAIRAVSIGAREGTEGLRLMQFQIDQQGTAAEVAAARTEGLAGQFSALQSNLQTLGVEIGGIVSGPLTALLTSLNNAITAASDLVTALGKLSKVKIPPIDIGVNIDFGNAGGGRLGDIANQVKGVVESAVGQSIAQVVIGPAATATLRAKAITESIANLAGVSDKSKQKIAELNDELRQLQKARVDAEKGGQSQIADQLTKRIDALKNEIDGLTKTGKGIDTGVNEPLRRSLETLEKLRESARAQDVPFIDALIASLKKQIPISETAAANAGILRDTVDSFGHSAQTAASGADALSASLNNLNAQAFAANSALLKLQNEGASPQVQIENLRQQRKIQEDRIAAIKANGNQARDATKINAAREQINSIQAQIDSLLAGIASDAKAAATSAENSANAAQKERDKQFQAIADLFGGRQENIENKIARAGIAGNIQKQINLTKALVASLKKERAALLDRLKTLKVSNAVRKTIMQAITRAIEQARQDILRLNKEQADRLADFSTPAIDIRIRIAQARDNVAQEIRLRRQRLALITKELVKLKNAGKKNTLAWLELKAQQAEEAAAIRDLEKQTKDKNDATKSAFFTFLQSQQGFAANLLGNLIPGFATRGLVGGSSDAAASNLGLGRQNQGGGFEEPRGGVASQAALASSRERGVRPVQVDTTNSLLRQILAALQGRQSKPPEATFNYSAARASYDTMDHGW